jgi:hypothetical protein
MQSNTLLNVTSDHTMHGSACSVVNNFACLCKRKFMEPGTTKTVCVKKQNFSQITTSPRSTNLLSFIDFRSMSAAP